MSRAPQKKLEESVTLAGPYAEQRLRALRTGVDRFRRSPDLPQVIRGPLPAARRSLKGLPQMGEGGAYRMLLFAADHPVLPVDAPVSRVARRLGYGQQHADFAKTARSVREAVSGELQAGRRDVPPRVPVPVPPRLRHVHRSGPALHDLSAARGLPGREETYTLLNETGPALRRPR